MLQRLLERSVINSRLDIFGCFAHVSTNSVKSSRALVSTAGKDTVHMTADVRSQIIVRQQIAKDVSMKPIRATSIQGLLMLSTQSINVHLEENVLDVQILQLQRQSGREGASHQSVFAFVCDANQIHSLDYGFEFCALVRDALCDGFDSHKGVETLYSWLCSVQSLSSDAKDYRHHHNVTRQITINYPCRKRSSCHKRTFFPTSSSLKKKPAPRSSSATSSPSTITSFPIPANTIFLIASVATPRRRTTRIVALLILV